MHNDSQSNFINKIFQMFLFKLNKLTNKINKIKGNSKTSSFKFHSIKQNFFKMKNWFKIDELNQILSIYILFKDISILAASNELTMTIYVETVVNNSLEI